MFWGDCELVFNKEYKLFDPAHHSALLKYLSYYKDACNENIWLDHKTNQYFSAAQTLSVPNCGQNHNLSSGWMLSRYKTLRHSFADLPEIVTTEFRCGFCDSIEKIHNQDSVFIIGGGPSTNYIDFSKYKHIPKWTMNSFFLNKSVEDIDNIQLVTFLDDVNISDERILHMLQLKQPLVIQEISDLGSRRIEEIKNLHENVTYMHTRYRSRLGVGARLIVLAILLGIKNIYISGMDGYNIESSDTHSFENNKSIPNWLKSAGPWLQKQQLVVFWDYILNTLSKSHPFKIHDLSIGQNSVQYKFIQEHF